MRKINLIFSLGIAVLFVLGSVPVAESFIIDPEMSEMPKRGVLITSVFDSNWHIAYGFAAAQSSKENVAAIHSEIANSLAWGLLTWLEPLADEMEAGQTLVAQFTVYQVPAFLRQSSRGATDAWLNDFDMPWASVRGVAAKKEVHLRAVFHGEAAEHSSYLSVSASEIHLVPGSDERSLIPHTGYSNRVLLHELGHTFGLPDAYSKDAIMSTR